ncbi:MAG: esterase/lipase family protein [Chlamydiota bacterium]
MSNQNTKASNRSHIVLIPGFAGFDALGQLEYYAGVTDWFQKRRAPNQVLHYFDNFPTAAVVTRAARLQSYLAKRIVRGEISGDDQITLVGHSTGGLDIRRLLWNLRHRDNKRIVVDGKAEVEPADILHRVRRVVFLSVPHWGTNIADWVRAQAMLRMAVVAEMRAAVAGSQVLLLDWIQTSIMGSTARLTGSGLFRAVQDALSEANEYYGKRSQERKAEAHEAASELSLYLRHMASDFAAIDDLASRPHPSSKPVSPAHFTAADRQRELRPTRPGHEMKFLSYVTIGRRPFRFDLDRPAPLWELSSPLTYPEITRDSELSLGTDIAYRTCYRACAAGPFRPPVLQEKVTRRLAGAPRHALEMWDNDGIVNTLSMLWPAGDNVLVPGDHMDIVGHYKPVKAERGGGRKFRAYDLLKSDSGFKEKTFQRVWKEIFAFCRSSLR